MRVPRLFEELAIAHGDGRYVKFITHLAKVDVLLLDDWCGDADGFRAAGFAGNTG